jgi:hypothetical protein
MIRTLLTMALVLLMSGSLLWRGLHGAALPGWAVILGVCVVGALWAGAFGAGVTALAAGVVEIIGRAFGTKS